MKFFTRKRHKTGVYITLQSALLLMGCTFFFKTDAQTNLAIGQWRSHLPYQLGRSVTQSPSTVYYATPWSVISFDKTDLSTGFLTTVEGLSNTGIRLIKYHPAAELLLVVYNDGIIDLVREEGVTTLNQVKNFANFLGDKEIRQMTIANDSIVYLAANYGFSALNVKREEFAYTTFTGVAVENALLYKGDIYMSTAEGIYRGDAGNPNLLDFSEWTLLGQTDGFRADYSAKLLGAYNDRLYCSVNDTLFRYQGGELQYIYAEKGFEPEFLSGEGRNLLMGWFCTGFCQGKVMYLSPDGNMGQATPDCISIPRGAVEDASGRVWFADEYRDYRYSQSVSAPSCDIIRINSPYSERVWDFAFRDQELWVAAGGVDPRFNYLFWDDGVFNLIDGQWSRYGDDRNPAGPFYNTRDFTSIAVHPETGEVFMGSFLNGLMHWDGEKFILYNDKNSSLNGAVGDAGRTRVSDIAFDRNNNLWVANHLAARPLSVRKADGTWRSFALPGCNETDIQKIAVDGSGTVWMVAAGSSQGLIAFNPGNLDDSGDDQCRLFPASQILHIEPGPRVTTVAVDMDDVVWLGTTKGLAQFPCGFGSLENCQGALPTANVDGERGYLLRSQDTRVIAIDGANRKWVGTRNGIFVISPDGMQQIARFTTSNSPLFDNLIKTINIHPETGEVFIGTEKGIISYRGDAIEGGNFNKANVQVFPNPVRPEYDGPIAIKGLARDADVKITDITGRLVYETQSLGGQAVWNGRDYNGRRVNSGVYLVYVLNAGSQFTKDAVAAKIVVIN